MATLYERLGGVYSIATVIDDFMHGRSNPLHRADASERGAQHVDRGLLELVEVRAENRLAPAYREQASPTARHRHVVPLRGAQDQTGLLCQRLWLARQAQRPFWASISSGLHCVSMGSPYARPQSHSSLLRVASHRARTRAELAELLRHARAAGSAEGTVMDAGALMSWLRPMEQQAGGEGSSLPPLMTSIGQTGKSRRIRSWRLQSRSGARALHCAQTAWRIGGDDLVSRARCLLPFDR